jgi:Flp pilus assembly protein CpaB
MAYISPKKTSKAFDWQKWLVVIGLGMIAALGAWYLYMRGLQPITIVVPAHDLPMYHLMTNTDLMTISVLPDELSPEALRSESDLVGQYTREQLTAGKTVLAKQLVPSADPALSIDTTIVSISATGAMTFGGRLTSGDIVTLWNVPSSRVASTTELLLDQALVLDVLPALSAPTTSDEKFPYVVILVVPIDHQAEILSTVTKGSLVFTLQP